MSEWYLYRAGRLAHSFLGAVDFLAGLTDSQREQTIFARRLKSTVNEDPTKVASVFVGENTDDEC